MSANKRQFDDSKFQSAFHDDRVMESMLNKMLQSERDQTEFVAACMGKISNLDTDEELSVLGEEAYNIETLPLQNQADAVQLMGIAALLLVGCFMYSMFLALEAPQRAYPERIGAKTIAPDRSVFLSNNNTTASERLEVVGIILDDPAESPLPDNDTVALDLEGLLAKPAADFATLNKPKSDSEIISPDDLKDLFVEDTPKRRLDISVDFNWAGRASLLLNDTLVAENMESFEAKMVLQHFIPELNMRSVVLGPRLGRLFGNITIGTENKPLVLTYDSANKFCKVAEQAAKKLEEIPGGAGFKSAKTKIALSEMVKTTNELFQGWAQDAINAGVSHTPMYRDSNNKFARVIDERKFDFFARTGQFTIDPNEIYLDETTIQHLASHSLRNQLAEVQELSLFDNSAEFNSFKNEFGRLPSDADFLAITNYPQPLRSILKTKRNLVGLPMVMGNDCHMDEHNAESMELVSRQLGPTMSRSIAVQDQRAVTFLTNTKARALASRLPEYVADKQKMLTVDQMVQHGLPEMKYEFIKRLGQQRNKQNANLLACYAKFDIDSRVRKAATAALACYEPEIYRKSLLDGFSYPWHIVAEHSAEALVRLNDKGSISKLLDLLEKPHPNAPYQRSDGKYFRRELVAVNHMKNCLLCHGVSYSDADHGRAVVPEWNRPIPSSYYHPERQVEPIVARADITYLRQDFSVVQPVVNHGHWPKNQRFDYVVREFPVSFQKVRFHDELDYQPYRNAVTFALQKLTGQTPDDNRYSTWERIARETQSNDGESLNP